jgi:hypothetical protein
MANGDQLASGLVPPSKEELSQRPPSWEAWRATWGKRRGILFSPELALRWLTYLMSPLAIFRLLELIGRLAILVALVSWFAERGDRRESKHNQAWAVIMAAKGERADGGRKNALESLAHEGISLGGAPLQRADLYGINLNKAQLFGSNFSDGRLFYSKLEDTSLNESIFERTTVLKSSFKRANIVTVKFTNTTITDSDFTDAILLDVDFSNANIDAATLRTVQAAKLCQVTLPTKERVGSDCAAIWKVVSNYR